MTRSMSTRVLILGAALITSLLTYAFYRRSTLEVHNRSSEISSPQKTGAPATNTLAAIRVVSNAKKKNAKSPEQYKNLVKSSWRAQFEASHDYFAFVQRAAVAAFHGDGDAALYVARAVQSCNLQVALYGHARNPRASLNDTLAEQGHMSEFARTRAARDFDRCKGFFAGTPFSSLPPRKRGYMSYTYWFDAAYKDHNPVAAVLHLAQNFPAIGGGASSQLNQKATSTLVNAVASGDPEAIFRAGEWLRDGHGSNITDAYALDIAACHLGYDCSTRNSFIFGDCAEIGACASGEEFKDQVIRAIGFSNYSNAYATAQQIEMAISERNTATIKRFIGLRK